MTKKLTSFEKSRRALVRAMRLMNEPCGIECAVCPYSKHKEFRLKFFTLTGMLCPKNQVRRSIEMTTGIDRISP